MFKYFFLVSLIFGVAGCNSETDSLDYFAQTTPGKIPVIFAPGVISVQNRFEHGISFSPDGRELAFGVLNKNDFSGVIYYSEKISKTWSEPNVFAPLENESVYLPYFSPDGKSLVYTQSRTDSANFLTDIWVMNKEGDSWLSPQEMSGPLNTLGRESTACMTLDRKIYFSSNRNGNGLADLYCSKPENGNYLAIQSINSLNTVRDEESIFISPTDSYTIFSRYVNNQNCPDLFISYRNSEGKWIHPVPIDSTINSTHWERRPFVSADSKYLFFTRMTFGEKGLLESDIFWVNTENVFKPFIYNPVSDTTVKIGVKIEIHVPEDYFRSVVDKQLTFKVHSDEIKWLEFENTRMILSGVPAQAGEFELEFTAIDKYSNISVDKVKIIVED